MMYSHFSELLATYMYGYSNSNHSVLDASMPIVGWTVKVTISASQLLPLLETVESCDLMMSSLTCRVLQTENVSSADNRCWSPDVADCGQTNQITDFPKKKSVHPKWVCISVLITKWNVDLLCVCKWWCCDIVCHLSSCCCIVVTYYIG